MKIKNVREMEYFTAADGCRITETFGIPSEGIREGSIAFAILSPGQKTDPHKHTFREWYIITKGSGALYIDEEKRADVKAGDNILMPEDGWHSIENNGTEELEFYCFCVPAFDLNGTTMKDGTKPTESVERTF